MRYLTARSVVAVALLASLGVPAPAAGARGSPDPLVTQFDKGHGLLIGSIVAVADAKPRHEWDDALLITFRTDEIIAAPTADDDWPIERGATFTLRTYAGYGGAIERWYEANEDGKPEIHTGGRPPVGARFLLSVRRDVKGGGLDHADGAGVAEPLLELSKERRRAIREVRGLATLAGAARVARCRALAGDAAATPLLRVEAIRHLSDRCFHSTPARHDAEDAARESERRETARVLRAAWADPAARRPDEVLMQLDAALAYVDFRSFSDSDERRAVWLAHLLAPPPPGTPEGVIAALHDRQIGRLEGVAGSRPEQVAGPLMREMASDRWPFEFRNALHTTLVRIWQKAETPDPRWEDAIRDHFTDVLPHAGSSPTRSLVGSASWLLDAREGSQPARKFRSSPALVASLRAAYARAKAEASKPQPDREFAIVVDDLERLLAWIDAQDDAPDAAPDPAADAPR